MLVDTPSGVQDTVGAEKGRPMTTITDVAESGTMSSAHSPGRLARTGGR